MSTDEAIAAYCPNHPHTAVENRCDRCGRAFCSRCLVRLRGNQLCGTCKPVFLREIQSNRQIDPARVVFWARVYDWALAAPALFWAAICLFEWTWPNPENEYMEFYQIAAVLGLVFPLPSALGVGRGRPWAYYYQWATFTVGTVLASCSLTILSPLLWVPAVYLFVQWQHPDVRRYCEQGS